MACGMEWVKNREREREKAAVSLCGAGSFLMAAPDRAGHLRYFFIFSKKK